MSRFAQILRAAVLLCVALAMAAPEAAGERRRQRDRFGTLAQMLSTAKASKSRLAAAVALTDMRDPRAVGPLIFALSDKSPAVRAVAAAGLGELRAQSALGPLNVATDDPNRSVRLAATDAIAQIRDLEAEPAPGKRKARYRVSAKERPRVADHPLLYVVLKSTADKSDKSKRKERKWREKQMQTVMTASFGDMPGVTTKKRVARRHRLAPYYLDVSIQQFRKRNTADFVEVECEIRVAISTRRGKMLSVMSGGAVSQVPLKRFRRHFERQMQSDALASALQGIQSDIFAFLQSRPS